MPRTPEITRKIMSAIKSTNTKPEMLLRKALWKKGLRYRVHYKLLPGKPDIVFTKVKLAVFCDGEFWHGKDWDTKKERIQSNREYWEAKIERNIQRDNETDRQLEQMGWAVIRFWGLDIQKNLAACVEAVEELIFDIKLNNYKNFRGIEYELR